MLSFEFKFFSTHFLPVFQVPYPTFGGFAACTLNTFHVLNPSPGVMIYNFFWCNKGWFRKTNFQKTNFLENFSTPGKHPFPTLSLGGYYSTLTLLFALNIGKDWKELNLAVCLRLNALASVVFYTFDGLMDAKWVWLVVHRSAHWATRQLFEEFQIPSVDFLHPIRTAYFLWPHQSPLKLSSRNTRRLNYKGVTDLKTTNSAQVLVYCHFKWRKSSYEPKDV